MRDEIRVRDLLPDIPEKIASSEEKPDWPALLEQVNKDIAAIPSPSHIPDPPEWLYCTWSPKVQAVIPGDPPAGWEAKLKQVNEALKTVKHPFWMGRNSGFKSGYVTRQRYIQQLRVCFQSGDQRRIESAEEEMARHLNGANVT